MIQNPSDNDRKTPKPERQPLFMEAYYDGGIEPKWMDFDDSLMTGSGFRHIHRWDLEGTQFVELQGFGFQDSNRRLDYCTDSGKNGQTIFLFQGDERCDDQQRLSDSDPLNSNGK